MNIQNNLQNILDKFPKNKVEYFISNFAKGLKEDQDKYKIKVYG